MNKKIRLWLPVAFWMAVIFFMSSQPDLPHNKIHILDFIMKKTAHMLEYGIFVFLISRAFMFKKLDLSFLLALSYAFTDEIHQLFVVGRGGKLTDVCIDLLGIAIATYLIFRNQIFLQHDKKSFK